MTRRRLEVRVTVRTPVMTRGQDVTRAGIDVAPLKKAGQAVVPGTLVRGTLRHAWEELVALGATIPVERWLGAEEKPRANLAFAHHFVLEELDETVIPSEADERISLMRAAKRSGHDLIRVAISEETGTVLPKHLQVVSSPWAAGRFVQLRGWVDAPATECLESLRDALLRGFAWGGAIGMHKGVGFGHISSHERQKAAVAITILEPGDVTTAWASSPDDRLAMLRGGTRWRLDLSFDRPLCFAEARAADSNRFVSRAEVPGAALVACLARRIRAEGVAFGALDQLSVSHGRPGGALPARPQSWVMAVDKDGETKTLLIADAAREGAPFLFATGEGDGSRVLTPSFGHDWKAVPASLAGYAHDLSPDWLEMHTAIESGARHVKPEQLFSLLCIDHVDGESPRSWAFELNVEDVSESDRETLARLLLESTNGPFGKTDAWTTDAQLEVVVEGDAPTWEIEPDDKVFVQLASDACLLEPTHGRIAKAKESYATYWNEISGGALSLEDLFLRERLAGGRFLHERFHATSEPYEPDTLTEAGSVFVLRAVVASRATQLLAQWARSGLPESKRYRGQRERALPLQCPWSSHNGYGRITPLPILPPLPDGWEMEHV